MITPISYRKVINARNELETALEELWSKMVKDSDIPYKEIEIVNNIMGDFEDIDFSIIERKI